MIVVLAALASIQTAPVRPAPPTWPMALRCAGLTQAASELEGGETGRGRRLFDAALYWSLTANDVGARQGVTPGQAEAEQTRARVQAVRELSDGDAAARADLDRCLADTPELG